MFRALICPSSGPRDYDVDYHIDLCGDVDQCGNQQHSRELLMMGIVMPETYLSYKRYNKIKSGI